ncbi:hypothetical protein GCM10009753_78130 [Streptantibioticus ferralitis]
MLCGPGRMWVRSLKRASGLTREGLPETRWAVHALREDSVPLPELLTTLVAMRDQGEDETAAPVTVRIMGRPAGWSRTPRWRCTGQRRRRSPTPPSTPRANASTSRWSSPTSRSS